MGIRKKTPDILGSLLGGRSAAPTSPTNADDTPSMQETPTLQRPPATPPPSSDDGDAEYGEGLLSSAAAKIKAASKVLDRQRLLDWLDQMQQIFGDKDATKTPSKETSLTFRAAEWAQRHLKAVAVATDYRATGLKTEIPYIVDICAHLKGERFRPDMNLWIDCKAENENVTKQDLLEFVEKATDVFHAARADKQEFGFDRIMIVSMVPFEKNVLDTADEYGVICVFYDRTSFIIQSDPYWKLKPRWLKDAEADRR